MEIKRRQKQLLLPQPKAEINHNREAGWVDGSYGENVIPFLLLCKCVRIILRYEGKPNNRTNFR